MSYWHYIHFELARLPAGPTVDELQFHIDDFRRFWAIFASMAWAKQHRECKQWMRFDAFSQVKRRHAFLIIAISIFTIFRGHFAVILYAFWCNFARFWIPVRKPDLRLRMNLGARQNASFLSIFEAFLTLQKSSSPHCFADFLKNKYKTWSRKSDPFWGHPYSWDRFFEFFTRPRKKRAPGDDWWVWNIKLRGSASTQKWSKNDASLSVDGFGGVRNVHRIRASGDVLFFHIVKYRIRYFLTLYGKDTWFWWWTARLEQTNTLRATFLHL